MEVGMLVVCIGKVDMGVLHGRVVMPVGVCLAGG